MKNRKNKFIQGYIREINQTLSCSKDMKKALLHEIEQQISELESRVSAPTIDDLYNEIGSPEEIALSFESRSDIEKIRKSAAKYRKTKFICLVSFVLAILVTVIATVVVYANDDYHSSIQSNSAVEEVTS